MAGLVAGCGSSSDDANGRGSEGAGGNIIVNPGGGAGAIPGVTDTRNGGSVDLSADTVKNIENAACKGWAAQGEARPAALQLVVDVSSSMNERAPGTNLTKWEATRDALGKAIVGDGTAAYPGLSSGVPVGLLFYPNVPSGASVVTTTPADLNNCVDTSALVPISILGDAGAPQRTRIKTGLAQVKLSTGTPTNDAYDYALSASMLPFKFSGDRFMLLITDGTPTLSKGCMNPSGRISSVNPRPVVDAVANAYSKDGIRTFVIGSPGSEDARSSLSAAARLGGTASAPNCSDSGRPQYCHMDMTAAPDFSKALRDGLGAVTGELKSCTYDFPTAPAGSDLDPKLVNIIVRSSAGASKLLLADDTPNDCTVGFQITASQQVVLCPQSCAEVQSDIKGTLELMFGCTSTQIPH